MSMWLRYALLCVTACFLVAGHATAGGTIKDLTVLLAAEKPTITGDETIFVRVRITNNTDEVVAVPPFQLPQKGISTPLFSVTALDGTPVRYIGAMVKWAPKAFDETVKFAPNSFRDYVVELGRSYAFGNGAYRIQYVGLGLTPSGVRANSTPGYRLSPPLILTIQGRASLNLDETPRAVPGPDGNLSFPPTDELSKLTVTSCSSSQIKRIKQAAKGALGYAKNASSYFRSRTNAQATPRYLTWFGNPQSAYWSTATANFNRIFSALSSETINFDCSCTTRGVYAFVYPTEPYNIYLCSAYWMAPIKGTDSMAGTIIHEMSHFTVLGGTIDWVYGQTSARQLAVYYPDRAVNNADNHEYFAENNPRLK